MRSLALLRSPALRACVAVYCSLAALLIGGCHSSSVPGPAPQRGQMATSSVPLRFADVTQRAGIRWQRSNGAFGQRWFPETTGGGGAFIDYDNDGWPDIVLVNGDWWPGHPLPGPRPTLALYHNNHDGTFRDVTREMGLNLSLQGMGIAVGDYDNDGFDDLYITGVGGNRLLHNEGGKRFTDVTRAASVGGSGWSTSVAWLDVDNDGKLDLFVCHYVAWSPATDRFCGSKFKTYCTPVGYAGESCRLYHNEGGGRFRDITRQAGLFDNAAKALGVCVADVNHDGRMDLIVANDQEPNSVYQNKGDGTFASVGMLSGIALAEDGHARAGMGVDAGDYRNDGRLGVLIGNFSFQGAALSRENAPGLFSDAARETGVMGASFPFVTFGVLFCDLDNDGWQDIVLANGHVDDQIALSSPAQSFAQPPTLLRNQGDGTFADVTAHAGPDFASPLVGRGLAWGDFDNDGRPDLLMIPNIGPPRLLHNETPLPTQGGNHGITLALIGAQSNRDAFGAQVRVASGGLTRSDTVRSGSSYCSQSDRRLHFGLGKAAQADRLEVAWPSGRKQTFGPLAADTLWTLTEGSAAPKPIPYPR